MIDFVEHYTYTWVIISVISHLTICGLILCPDDLYGCTLQITSVSLYNFTGVVIAEASSEVSVGSFHELSGHCSCKQQYCAINCCIRMIASLFVLLQFGGNGWVVTIVQTNHNLGSGRIGLFWDVFHFLGNAWKVYMFETASSITRPNEFHYSTHSALSERNYTFIYGTNHI